jgi:hypothetical protein
LILTPSEFVSALEPFASHKESHGVRTKITTLSEIYGNYLGRDEPEQNIILNMQKKTGI